MASVSETGHAKNVANLQDLISFVTGYGATYNPTKNALKLPQLTALATASQTSLADVITKNPASVPQTVVATPIINKIWNTV